MAKASLRPPHRLSLAFFLMLGLALPLSACGFRPLYGDHGAATNSVNELAQVSIDAPETSVGRSIKFQLLDTINATGDQPVSPLYTLTLLPTSYSQNIAVQQDASVTRANFVLVVPYALKSTATGKIVFHSTSRARSSYNRVDSEFANLSAAKDAEKRTAEAVAADIKLQLGVYFDRLTNQQGGHEG